MSLFPYHWNYRRLRIDRLVMMSAMFSVPDLIPLNTGHVISFKVNKIFGLGFVGVWGYLLKRVREEWRTLSLYFESRALICSLSVKHLWPAIRSRFHSTDKSAAVEASYDVK